MNGLISKFEKELNLEHLNTIELDDTIIISLGGEVQDHKFVISIAHEVTSDDVHLVDSSISLCSKDDRYKEEVGVAISVGRVIIKAQTGEPALQHKGEDSISGAVFHYVLGRLSDLESALIEKEMGLELFETIKRDALSSFSVDFDRLK